MILLGTGSFIKYEYLLHSRTKRDVWPICMDHIDCC